MVVIADIIGGGLGNLLFMHHAAYAEARRRGGAPLWLLCDYHDGKRPNVAAYADLFAHARLATRRDVAALGPDVVRHDEPRFSYTALPTGDTGGAHLRVRGYLQSWRYFAGLEEELRDTLWRNVAPLHAEMAARHAALHAPAPTLCLHVRRGDYVGLQGYHPLASDAYYAAALAEADAALPPGTRLVVFSDDVPFVRGWPLLAGRPNVHVETEPDALRALLLMSFCDHFILANSSLSLSAVHLRRGDAAARANTRVWAPLVWFGPDAHHDDFAPDDVLPPGPHTRWL